MRINKAFKQKHLYGICGKKGAGKDTLCGFIRRSEVRFERFAFADELKFVCSGVFNVELSDLHCPIKKEAILDTVIDIDSYVGQLSAATNLPIKKHGMLAHNLRELLQYVGTDYVRSLDDEFWVNRLKSKLLKKDTAIVSDVRFPNEVDTIRALGGKIIRVVRDGASSADAHASEKALDSIDADLTVLVKTGDTSLLEQVAGLLAVRRFDLAKNYDISVCRQILAARKAGHSLEYCNRFTSLRSHSGYTSRFIEAYYNGTLVQPNTKTCKRCNHL